MNGDYMENGNKLKPDNTSIALLSKDGMEFISPKEYELRRLRARVSELGPGDRLWPDSLRELVIFFCGAGFGVCGGLLFEWWAR